ncbi:MAG: hypothetical protein ACP5I4_14405 [Oceanipulchritudo sp.]
MKKTAFLQAVILFILLTGAWFLLFQRLGNRGNGDEDKLPAPSGTLSGQEDPAATEKGSPPPLTSVHADRRFPESVPDNWREWIRYLAGQSGPEDMRRAVADLGNALRLLPKEEAAARIMELLASGADLPTGLPFRVGRQGRVLSSGTLRAHLLDWLLELAPETAGKVARRSLEQRGTNLPPDEYLIHLRNAALAIPPEDPGREPLLRRHFKRLLAEENWMDNPGPAVAEAMDIPVYLQATDMVPAMAGLTGRDKPLPLRHASSLALERLVEQHPLRAARLLLASPEGKAMIPEARAGLLARIDPSSRGAGEFLRDYLASPDTSPREASAFLGSFPNLNRSRSHNLLSPEFPDTNSPDPEERIHRAIREVERWKRDPELSPLRDVLAGTEERLYRQLTGKPSP